MATITETLQNRALTSYAGSITFQPTTEVGIVGNDVQSGQPISLSITAGALSTTLVEGQYVVSMEGTTPFTITVPSGNGSYELHELITDTGVSLDPSETYLRASEQSLTAPQKATVQYNSELASYADVAGVPWLASRGELVVSGCTLTPASGTAWGMAGAVDAHLSTGFVNLGNQGRLTNSGVIKAVRFYVPATLPVDCEVYIDIWREVESGLWRVVGTTGNIRASVTANGTVQTVTLTNQIRGCQIGDHVGGRLVYTDGSWGAGFHAIDTPSGYPGTWPNQDMVWSYSTVLADYAQWDQTTTIDGKTIPIQCYMDSPSVCIVGDSRGVGHQGPDDDGAACLISGSGVWHKENDMAARLETLTQFPVCNVSISGQDSGELETRFAADVVARHAAVVVILDTYYNDIYASRNKATVIASTTAMIDAALADGSKVVVAWRYPFNDPAESASDDGRDLQNAGADEWWLDIKALCDTYDENDVLCIDLADALGEHRPESTADDYVGTNWVEDNKWNLQALYDSGDGLHLAGAGAYQMARVLNTHIRNWLRTQSGVSTHQPIVLADAGDADVTMTRPLRSVTILPYATTLTGNKTVTLPTSANHGDVIRVVRTGLGAYTLDVGGLKTIGSGTAAYVEATWDGDAWILTGYGAL